VYIQYIDCTKFPRSVVRIMLGNYQHSGSNSVGLLYFVHAYTEFVAPDHRDSRAYLRGKGLEEIMAPLIGQ